MIKALNYVTAQSMRYAFKLAKADVVYRRLVGSYFSEKEPQRTLTAIAALRMGTFVSDVCLTYVARNVINQMATKDAAAFHHELVLFVISLLAMVSTDRAQSLMSDRLGRSLTNFSQKEMGRMWVLLYSKNRPDVKDPEQRMTNDITEFVKIMHQLSDIPLKIINALVCSYILCLISPSLFVGTLAIGSAGTWLTKRISQKQTQQEQTYTNATASYRQLVSYIHGHQTAVLNGGGQITMLSMLDERLQILDKAAHDIIKTRNITNSISEMIDNVIVFVPYVMASFTFFNPASRWTLGSFRQGEEISEKLNDAVSWPRRNTSLLKQLQAYAVLLTEFLEGCMLDAATVRPLSIAEANQPPAISVNHLSLRDKQGSLLCDKICFEAMAGDRMAIQGSSGSGKSMLLATIAGIISHRDGTIDYTGIAPQSGDLMYVPAESPILQLSIRHLMSFPQPAIAFTDEDILRALNFAELTHKAHLMDENLQHGKDFVFSDGERQKLAFARIYLHRPKILCLDNITSHLSVDVAVRLYKKMITSLPDSMILSTSTSEDIIQLHKRLGTIRHEEFLLSDLQTAVDLSPRVVVAFRRERTAPVML